MIETIARASDALCLCVCCVDLTRNTGGECARARESERERD